MMTVTGRNDLLLEPCKFSHAMNSQVSKALAMTDQGFVCTCTQSFLDHRIFR